MCELEEGSSFDTSSAADHQSFSSMELEEGSIDTSTGDSSAFEDTHHQELEGTTTVLQVNIHVFKNSLYLFM